MINKIKNLRAGFTLVELLIVIAILGVLSTVLITAINPLEQLARARDTGRKSDLKQIANALERYQSIHGKYPITTSWCGALSSYYTSCGADWIPGLVASGELKKLPTDPSTGVANSDCADTKQVSYLYLSPDGTRYKVLAHCAIESTAARTSCGANVNSDAFCDPVRPTWAYQISSDDTARTGY